MDSDGVYHSFLKDEAPLREALDSFDMNETFMFQAFHSSSQRKLRAHNKKLNKKANEVKLDGSK